MSKKELEVTCPCCSARLAVDVLTEQVLRWRRPEELDPQGRPKVDERDWSDALGRVEGRLQSGEDRFDSSLRKERSRASDLDELFRDAAHRVKKREEQDD